MSFFTFLFEAVSISLSAIMAPGPITAVTVGKGAESPHAGALVAMGHGIIEFPLMISIFYGLGYFLSLYYIRAAISSVGGILLLIMGISMFQNIEKIEISSVKYTHSAMTAGIILSLGNPYFLIWWATVGATLISHSVIFGILGFFVFALLHWLCDFLWCYFLSALSFKGGQFFGEKFQKIIFVICGTLLLFFSGKFIVDGVRVFSR